MIVILTLMAFLFGAATYFAEKDSNGESFDSILKGTYWANKQLHQLDMEIYIP